MRLKILLAPIFYGKKKGRCTTTFYSQKLVVELRDKISDDKKIHETRSVRVPDLIELGNLQFERGRDQTGDPNRGPRRDGGKSPRPVPVPV